MTKKKKGKALRIALIVVAAILVCAIGGAVWLVNYIANPQNAFSELRGGEENTVSLAPTQTPTPTPASSAPAESDATPTPEPTATPPDYEFSSNRINILLLGVDSSVERVEAGMNFRTDTMILVTVDFDNKKVDMISIPRDSYVRINNGSRFNKINAAFTFGGGREGDGYEYAMNTVSYLLGVPVDYYVGFGMNVVKEVVDAMGGVDYDVDISFTLNGRETVEGYQHMDGQQVLDYCRWRKGGRGDIDRIDRQQRILFAIFEQMLKTDQVKNIPDIYTAVQENIDTNLDTLQIATLAWFAKDLSMDDIARHTVPGNGQYVGSTSYYIVYQNEKNEMVQEIFGVEGPFDEAITLEAIEARVAEQEGTLPGADEEATPEEITALQLQAQDMLTFMEERADMSSSEVSAAYSALQSAISSGSASALRSAIATAQSLLPGSESSVPALETPAPTADIPQEDGTNIYETFPSEDDSNVYE